MLVCSLASANVSGVNNLTTFILGITALIALLNLSLNPTCVLLEEFEISNWRPGYANQFWFETLLHRDFVKR